MVGVEVNVGVLVGVGVLVSVGVLVGVLVGVGVLVDVGVAVSPCSGTGGDPPGAKIEQPVIAADARTNMARLMPTRDLDVPNGTFLFLDICISPYRSVKCPFSSQRKPQTQPNAVATTIPRA